MDDRLDSPRRKSFFPWLIFATFVALMFCDAEAACGQSANENGYYPYTIARPQDREWLRSMPIEQRPDRPLHFYGNVVRGSSFQRPTYNIRVLPARGSETARPLIQPRLFRTNIIRRW